MFDDEKIKLIEQMPEGPNILMIWIKLLTLAGRCNATGYIYLAENIPYTEEMLSTIFNVPLNVLRLAIKTFEQFKMIEVTEEQYIRICNWEKHQNIEGLDKIREQNRLRNQKYREKQKLLNDVSVTSHDGTEVEVEVDKNKKEIYRKIQHLTLSVDEFNRLNEKYDKSDIDDILDQMENWSKLKSKVSAYLTANNWLKKRGAKKTVKIEEEKPWMKDFVPEGE